MLRAIDEKDKDIIPAKMERKHLLGLKETAAVFYCPACREPVMLKAGTKMIPHFAHFPNTHCRSGQGEGPYHEQGKWLLYKWLVSQGIECHLEAYIDRIDRRADLLAVVNGREIAIEYQCARTSPSEIQERMQDYKEAGIEQIWILGGNRLRRKGRMKLKLNAFDQLFIHRFKRSMNDYLYYFCPQKLQLAIFQDFYFTNHSNVFGKLHFHSIKEIKFPDLFSNDALSHNDLAALWTHEKRNFRLSSARHVFGPEAQFRQWLYLNQLHIEYLPSCIGLPVKGAECMKVPVWNWQSRLIVEVMMPIGLNGCISIDQIQYFMRHYKNGYRLSSLKFNGMRTDPIQQYIEQLQCLGILKEVRTGTFQLMKQIELHGNVEQSLCDDQQLMSEWLEKQQDLKQIRSMIPADSAIL